MLTLQAANFSEYRLVQKSPLQSFREGRAILFRNDSSMLICFLYMRSRQICLMILLLNCIFHNLYFHNPFFSTITNPEFQHLNEMRKRLHKVDAHRL